MHIIKSVFCSQNEIHLCELNQTKFQLFMCDCKENVVLVLDNVNSVQKQSSTYSSLRNRRRAGNKRSAWKIWQKE